MFQAISAVGAGQPQIHFPSFKLLLAWATFVVYGSLVPLDFRDVALEKLPFHFLGLGQPEGMPRSITDWATNIAIFVPFGFLGIASINRSQGLATALRNIFITLGSCIVLSVAIEFTQIFFPPRNSSVLDVVANAVGAALGVAGWYVSGAGTIDTYRALVSLHSLPRSRTVPVQLRITLLTCSGVLIAYWGGLFSGRWSGWDVATTRLASLRLPPFLEHQAANIGLALVSAAAAAMAYASLGFVLWALDICREKPLHARLVATSVVAAAIALLVEGVKLFLVARSPDTGNIVIAGLASGLAYLISPISVNRLTHSEVDSTFTNGAGRLLAAITTSIGLLGGRAIALVSAIAACVLVVTYPMGPIQFGLALLLYSAVLIRYPTAWLIVLPALLPVLDLAPWTGRFFFDEFDGLVLATLAAGLWRVAGQPLAASPGRVFWLLAAGFAISILVSSMIGLLPLQPIDSNALASPYSHYAALRQVKGLVFAVGLAVLISSHTAAGLDVKRAFGAGMILGLTTATASVIWERVAYAGLAEFTKDFRVVGLFSTMHTGGAHLDGFLVTALPFAAFWALRSKQLTARAAAALLFSAGVFAVMMTYSRAAVAALVTAMFVLAAWAFLSGWRTTGRLVNSRAVVAAGLTLLASLVVFPALFGSFMQSRLTSTGTDLDIRSSHWNDAMNIMTDDWSTSLFGMGLGRYPETYLLLSGEKNHPAIHRFETEKSSTFLRIQQGVTLYIEQIVAVEPRHDYKVALKARTQGRNATLNALLCDRTFLQGFGCQSVSFQLSGEAGKWQQMEAGLNSASIGENRLRIAKFSLENAGSDTPIDVDDVALIDSDGTNHLVNGTFQAGADRWFFSSPNNHLPWHIKNLWLEVFFEQGWVGLFMFCALVAATISRLALLAWRGKAFAAVLLAGLMGFLVVGAFDSMFDAPRLTLTFGLLIAVAGINPSRSQAVRPRARPTVDTGMPPISGALEATAHASTNTLADAIPLRKTALHLAAGVLLMAIFIAAVTRLPFVPYNVRELPNEYHPLLAPIVLAAFVFWVFGFPAFAARWLTIANKRGVVYPLLVAGHGLIAWAMLQFAVLPESIHDVIGSPVLHWPWQMEYIARFLPLLSVLSVQLTGGALLVAAVTGNRIAAAPLWWIVSAAALFPIQYWVIVTQAGTDNLTELMAGNASIGACLLLTTYLLLIGTNGSLLASLRSGASPRRVGLALGSLAISLPLGYLILAAGTEQVIVKEPQVFSALQFLLSTDREHYAIGLELWMRFAVAHLGTICLTALTQYPLWLGFQPRFQRQRRRRIT